MSSRVKINSLSDGKQTSTELPLAKTRALLDAEFRDLLPALHRDADGARRLRVDRERPEKARGAGASE